MPDRLESYQRIHERTSIPLAGAEHEYTRWGFTRWFDARALDVIQPDIYWAGGISEVTKIAAAASMHDLQTIPHGHSAAATLHFSLAQSPAHTPIQEHLEIWNRVHQFFLASPVVPVDGLLRPNDLPGLGMALDEGRIQRDDVVMAEASGRW
jgi:L-alanine-DL-glutamate epimerase-like enolase superfamily enzyme